MEKGGCTSKIKRDTISVIESVIMLKSIFLVPHSDQPIQECSIRLKKVTILPKIFAEAEVSLRSQCLAW